MTDPGMIGKAVRAVVSGQVHGVGFRQAAKARSRAALLNGWVRNELSNGTVEIWLQGEAGQVDEVLDWLWRGPPGALVAGVESEVVPPDRLLSNFVIRQ
jgi:acylphosphatase